MMADTITGECRMCGQETDLIMGACEECNDKKKLVKKVIERNGTYLTPELHAFSMHSSSVDKCAEVIVSELALEY